MSGITRRRALGVGAGAVTGLAAAHGYAQAARPPVHQHNTSPGAFDEIYLGRRIQGGPTGSHGDSHHGDHGGSYAVRIDGDELHIMRNADGTWISVINHYEPRTTPRALARAAVVELQGASLSPLATSTH